MSANPIRERNTGDPFRKDRGAATKYTDGEIRMFQKLTHKQARKRYRKLENEIKPAPKRAFQTHTKSFAANSKALCFFYVYTADRQRLSQEWHLPAAGLHVMGHHLYTSVFVYCCFSCYFSH